MSQPEIRTVVSPASLAAPRRVEAAILPFADGRLYLAYSEGERADHVDGAMPEGGIRLMGRWSHDEGASWSEPFLIRGSAGVPNVMEPSFVRLATGRVLQTYMQRDTYRTGGDSFGGMRILAAYSDDKCETWSEPVPITGDEAISFTTNDRLVPLRSGRILLPTIIGPDMTSVRTWLSDDSGMTWRKGGAVHAAAGIRYGYPIAAELSDSTVAMFLLNSTNRMRIARSNDGGDTWSPVETSGPEPCPATFMVRRIPETSDLLLIWNNHTRRTNLTSAISRDDARTWTSYRLLEAQDGWPPQRTYAFPSLAFVNGCAHMTWYERRAHPRTGAMFDLIYRRLPIAWYYDGPASSLGV